MGNSLPENVKKSIKKTTQDNKLKCLCKVYFQSRSICVASYNHRKSETKWPKFPPWSEFSLKNRKRKRKLWWTCCRCPLFNWSSLTFGCRQIGIFHISPKKEKINGKSKPRTWFEGREGRKTTGIVWKMVFLTAAAATVALDFPMESSQLW